MDAFVMQNLMNWLVLSSIYALVALGFSLLFGVLNVIHFSHGDVSIVAPFVVLATVQALIATAFPAATPGALVLACAAAIVVVGLIGVLADWLVIRRFRNAPAMMALVATVALHHHRRRPAPGFWPGAGALPAPAQPVGGRGGPAKGPQCSAAGTAAGRGGGKAQRTPQGAGG